MQTELILILLGLRLDDLADQFFQILDWSDKDKRIRNIERCVESSKHKAQLGSIGSKAGSTLWHVNIISNPATYHVDKRMEDAQYPDNSEDIEHHVCHCRTPCLRVCRQGGEV